MSGPCAACTERHHPGKPHDMLTGETPPGWVLDDPRTWPKAACPCESCSQDLLW